VNQQDESEIQEGIPLGEVSLAFPKILCADRDGGLLGHLTVWKNLTLPLEYHALDMRHVAEDAVLLFTLCGEENVSDLLKRYPDSLSLYEKRLVGFVRALLLEPDVLVLEDVLEGLSDVDKKKTLNWEAVFRLRFPFRTVLHRG
jgi:ABC-type molybdate transport system ATPase subunit